MEEKLHAIGIQKIGDLAKLDDRDLENRFGNGAWRWPESHAVKTQEAGSTTKSEKTSTRNQSATSTRSTRTQAMPSACNPR